MYILQSEATREIYFSDTMTFKEVMYHTKISFGTDNEN